MSLSILHLHNYSNWGGNLVHVRLLLQGLADDEFKLFFAVPSSESYIERFRDLEVTILPFEARSNRDFRAVMHLVSTIRKHNIELVHSHLRRTDWICAWARLLCPRLIWVTTVHGEVNMGPDFKRRKSIRNGIYGLVLARAFHRVLSVSRDLSERLIRDEGVEPSRVETLVNGVEITYSTEVTPEERSRCRRELGIHTAEPMLVIVGRYGLRKGHEVLLRAAALSSAAGQPWEILLVGDGDLEQEIRALARDLGLESRAHFCGFQRNVTPYLQAADVIALPSFSEGLPRALLEGMALGLAPVASDIGGVREALDAPRYGYTFPAGDSVALAEKLKSLWSSPGLRRELGQRARQRIFDDYRIEMMVEQHRKVYRRLSDNGRK